MATPIDHALTTELLRAGLALWGSGVAAIFALSDEVNGALLAMAVALLVAFVAMLRRITLMTVRFAEAWVEHRLRLRMRQQGFPEDEINEVIGHGDD